MEPAWMAFVDDAWGTSRARAVAIMTSPSGQEIQYALRLDFPCTNNTTEYEAIVLALQKSSTLGAWWLLVKSDSQVITLQVEKVYHTREPELAEYLRVI